MRLAQLDQVVRVNRARAQVLASIDAIERGQFMIYIGGVMQNDALHAIAAVSILAELRGRLASLDRDLQSFGVSTS